MKTKIIDPKRDIINTLNYKRIFNQPLNYYQLLYFSHYKFLDNIDFENNLSDLVSRGKVKFKNNVYYLSNTKIKNRDKKYNSAVLVFEKLNFLKDIFQKVPYIKMVAVTGSLASYYFDEEVDDIDLFIVAEKNRIWITRFFLVLIFKILNVYINNKNPDLKLCPNFYISSEFDSWDKSKHTIYTAHEILMMQPIYQVDDTYFKFLDANRWVLDFYPNFSINELGEKSYNNFDFSFLDILDLIVMFIQKTFMGKRSGHEVLKKNFIHFNKHDHSQTILDSYKRFEN